MRKEIDLWYGLENKVYPRDTAQQFKKNYKAGNFSDEHTIGYIGYHVEAGNYSFLDCANAAINELGEECLDNFMEWYLGYLKNGVVKAKGLDKDENEIKKINNFLYLTIRHKEYDQQLLRNIQRNSQKYKDGVYGELSSLEQSDAKGNSDADKAKKVTDEHSTTGITTGQGEGVNRNMDENNPAIYRVQSNTKGDTKGQEPAKDFNSPADNSGLHQLPENTNPVGNNNGNRDNPDYVTYNEREIYQVREKLSRELEIIFDVTDTITDKAKVLLSYYDDLGKSKTLEIINDLGYIVNKENELVFITKNEKKQEIEEIRILNTPESRIILGNKYKDHKVIEDTNDYSLIEYKGEYGVVYADNELIALCTDLNAAKKYMINQQESLYEEIREIYEQLENVQEIERKEAKILQLNNEQTPINQFIKAIKERIKIGDQISNTPQLRIIAQDCGMLQGIHYSDIKVLYDIASNALNQYIIENAKDFKVNRINKPDEIIKTIEKLDRLQDILPTETERSYDMVALQQFSTPLSLSLLANLIAEVDQNDFVLEPSAGEGNLVVFSIVNGARVIANEIDSNRSDLLKNLNVERVTNEDAKHIHAILKDDVISTVVMNPPFSRDFKKGNSMDLEAGRKHVESALEKLSDNGRLVAILGRGMGMDSHINKDWWEKIKNRYNVRANILIDGQTYRKKGTSFDNRIIVIDKNGITQSTLESQVKDYYELFNELIKIPLKQRININENNNVLNDGPNTRIKTVDIGKVTDAREPKPDDRSDAGSNIRTDNKHEGFKDVPTGRNRKMDLFPEPIADGENNSIDATNNRDNSSGNDRAHQDNGQKTNDGIPGIGSDVRNSSFQQRNIPGVNIESLNISIQEKKVEKQTDRVGYEQYIPEIKIEGAKPHPAKLVESTAMASVNLPKVSYMPMISKSVIEKGALSDAQLEDIILAGAATSQKLTDGKAKGFFLGAGTGYGKGRTLAAIIIDNLNRGNGKGKAVWLSKNENAHYDSVNYWKEIGGDEKKIIKSIKAGQEIAQNDGILLATYGMLSNKFEANEAENKDYWVEQPKSRMQQIVQWLGKDFDGVIVFDESHLMGNALTTKADRGVKKASLRALAGVKLQDMLPGAKIIYSSATGATEVMNLAYATRLGLWGDGTAFSNVHDFVNTIDSSGVAGMELVSRDLKAMGLYTSKSLSFDGVQYETLEHILSPGQRALYDQVAKAWQIILQNINQAIEINNTGNGKKAAVMSSFWGAHQRFFQQIIVAMQMPSLLASIEKDLQEGKSPIIQLINTNEAQTTRELAEKKLESGDAGIDYDDLELSPKKIMIEYLQRSFPTQLYETVLDEKGNEFSVPVLDSEGKPVLNPVAVEMRDRLIKKIDESIHLPEGPLDIIINTFGAENVAEVTGRSARIILKQDNEGLERKIEERRSKSHVSKDKDDFMDGKKSILVFSEAGGTGASFHADRTRKNQKQRVHYILQAGWRADAAVQGFGRSHRSNQAIEPIFKLVTTDLKAQRRFLSSIARRLDQLGALTKGQRQSGGQGILDGSYNLEGNYAKQALFEFYQDVEAGHIFGVSMETLEQQMALKIYKEDENGSREYNEDVIFDTKRFLNRLMSLEVDIMDRVFEGYMEHIEDQVKRAKNKGTYDEGIEVVKAVSTKVIAEEIIYQDEKTSAKTYLTEIQLEIENKKTSFDEMVSRMEKYGQRFEGFGIEKNSGKIYAFVLQKNANLEGGVDILIRRFSVVTETPIDYKDFVGKYEKVESNLAKQIWDKDYREYPVTRTKTEVIVKGAILPIWSNLPSSINVRRYLDDNGIPHLGRYYHKKDVSKIRETFNAIRNIEYDLKDVVNVLQQGGRAQLGNNIELVKKRHQGIDEILIEKVNERKERERLKRAGATFKIKENLTMSGDFYIPLHIAENVIGNILEIYNTRIISLEDKNGNQIMGKDKNEIIAQKYEQIVEQVGYRNLPPQMKTLFDNILRIVKPEQIEMWENVKSGEYGDSFMPLNIEKQELYKEEIVSGINKEGAYKLIMSQNYIQNGDLMDDPRIDIAVFPSIGAAYPLNYQQHAIGKYEQYVDQEKFIPSMAPQIKGVLNFINETWIPNLIQQGRIIRKPHEENLIQENKNSISSKAIIIDRNNIVSDILGIYQDEKEIGIKRKI